ncbi:hypothetical protein V3C99_007360 [Haemonchus contortus]
MADVEATFGIRVLAAILILLPTLCGLLLHTILGIVLYSGWRTFRGNSFYLITVQLMCADVCALILDLYAAFPLTLTGVQYMGDSVAFYYLPLSFESIAFNGIFNLSLLLTVNRFLLFLYPGLHKKIFTSRGTKTLSLLVWIYVFTFIIASNVAGCHKEFNKEYFYYWYNCGNDSTANHIKQFILIDACVIPCAMAVMYIAIYIKIRVAKKGISASTRPSVNKEIRYVVQTLLICILIFVEVAGFAFIPFLGAEGYDRFYLNILLNSIIISNNLVTPIVMLTFNSDVRQKLKQMYGGNSPTVSVVVYSKTFR